MFKGQGLVKPQGKSFLAAFAVTVLVIFGSQASAVVGYILALSALLMIIVAIHMESIWPTRAKKENALVFSLFWGLMIGLIVPFFRTAYLQGGATAVYEVLTAPP